MNFREKYFEIWKAVWELHKKHFNLRTSEDWAKLTEEAIKITEKYKGQFAKDLILATVKEIENNWRCEHGNNEKLEKVR